MLSVSALRAGYGQSEVLHGLDFSVSAGEIVAVMGRNGMGKSTLMKTLIGVLPIGGGEIVLDEISLNDHKTHQRVARGLAYVPQGRMIFPAMTVVENIETGLVVRGGGAVPQDIYRLFPVLEEMRGRRGGNLSGGQQQQLAIARALATNPKMLLLDEPTEGIQPSIIRDLARTLKRIRDERGLAILVSEQVLSFALDVVDRLFVLEGGRIVHTALRAEVDEAEVARFLAV
ncbi:MAG: urea ABC transporter ATP-binding subunit UrtE [Acidibrevibacterium sp.]|jgi:urea transport system ATP-binding protein|uniref:urea ABC transporter ATP-binding subunit UrtE n=1 Tax=Acidibrevibacterium fodinaquatile TaxID=1969806 RepID=UPI0023A7F689|nr:urea ABC transporter ATP-binding subunit UrtE [Acidibrevibacterium fodinaquatile]MCA7120635.1 urea ABC transporter ATP-binding subunit UrtE [Acidibrevibacterium fodinaquatile]